MSTNDVVSPSVPELGESVGGRRHEVRSDDAVADERVCDGMQQFEEQAGGFGRARYSSEQVRAPCSRAPTEARDLRLLQ